MPHVFKKLALLVLVFAVVGCSKTYPSKDITLIIQSAPGGGSDFLSRTLAPSAEKYLGKKINLINKAGATGSIGLGFVAASKPDGYTIGYMPSELALLETLGYSNAAPDKFDLILQVCTVPAVLAVPANAPYNTVAEFVAAAKKNPGAITVGNAGTGGLWDLGAVNFEKAAGIQLKHVPFTGSGPGLVAVNEGQINAIITGVGEAMPHIQSGKMKLLGVMDQQRSSFAENIPTFKEQGYDVQIMGWGGIGAPKGIPADVMQKLHDAFKKAFDEPAVQAAYAQRGFTHTYSSGSDFAKFVTAQAAFFKPLLASIGLSK